MASVTFPPAVGGDGSTVTDDNNATTGLGNGGHRTRFVPALSQVVAVAANTVTQATNAATSASQALTYRNDAQAAATSAAENAVLGKYVFSNTTTMADPGVGVFRLNNATLSSVTSVAVDAQTSDSGNPNILNYILTWDDSTSTVKGQLRVAKSASPTTFAIFDVTGLVNNIGWVQLTVSHVASAGAFTNNDVSYFEFFRTGDAGTGDVSLNGTQTLNNKSLVDSTTFIVDNTDSTKKAQFEVSGVTTGTTRTVTIPDENLTLAGRGANTFTGVQNVAKGSDVASASTIDLNNVTGNLIDVTGTTTINSITLQEGAERTVRFTNTLQLTHGSSLILQNSTNITTDAGDFAVFRGYSGGVVRLAFYQRFNGASLDNSGLKTGDVIFTGRTLTPPVWLRCDGSIYLKSSYPTLSTLLGNLVNGVDIWTARTSGFGSNPINALTYGNGLYVAGGGTGNLATSPDGITWTARTSGFGSTSINALTYGNGLYVAGGGTGNLATSPDGITWTARTSGFGSNPIFALTYGNGLYVAGGGTGNLATSPDGITWTARTSGFGVDTISDLAYSNGLYIAVGGTGNLATSPDGVTWTARTSGFGSTSINALTYGNGLYVAGGDTGKIRTSIEFSYNTTTQFVVPMLPSYSGSLPYIKT